MFATQAGAAVNQSDMDGRNALHVACQSGQAGESDNLFLLK